MWLVLLGPFFFASYGLANWLTSLRAHVPDLVFAWERQIPFVPWTIVPYWSIDAFYGLSLFVCASRAELDTHARRLLTAQVVAVTCFVLFPLRFTFEKPETDGVFGFLFAVLGGFDQPYNQAPSLHIALLVILWALYARHLPAWGRAVLHAWAVLVTVSVLTTYQHHFIDIPTGALLGFLCLWLWPDHGRSPLEGLAWTCDPKRRRLATFYALGALACAGLAVLFGGTALWLLWGTVACALVALIYAALTPAAFQKDADGRVSLAARVLLAPYHLAAWINSRAWTWRSPAPSPVADGVALGRAPRPRDLDGHAGVVDLSAELPMRSAGRAWRSIPMLDLVVPEPAALRAGAAAIEAMRAHGPVLVACALGYSRSSATVATWLLATGRAADAEAAVRLVRAARPRIVLDDAHLAAIAAAAGEGR
ncbi:MAG: serine/threonine protein phosphatase [Bradyrhizobiaceae bacterium]|nr:MAG: serine/threonine protein phosphatase [Bradyrhizobiaceae bacterium]